MSKKICVIALILLVILTAANSAGIFILLQRQDKYAVEQEESQKRLQEELDGKFTDSIISLQSYLMDSFKEQNILLKKTNTIAQEKKTAQAEQTAIISKDMSKGIALMSKKEYAKAKAVFDKVYALQPYNNEAKFYSVYSLFLQNKLKHTNYKLITDTFSSLRGAGYSRKEMEEVENFIKDELDSIAR